MSTFKGRVTEISQVETVGQNNHQKQTILVEETSGQYPESVAVEFFGKNQPKLERVNVGDDVEVAFNYKARVGKNGGYFQTLSGWRIDTVSHAGTGGANKPNTDF